MIQSAKSFVNASRSVSGFTLMEVLIVIGIFAIISTISFTALTQYISVSSKLEENYRDIENLQRAFIVLERDLRYMIDRPSRNTFGDREAPLLIDNLNGEPGEKIRFTSALKTPQQFAKLRRVAWALDQNSLRRISWNALDIEDDSVQSSRTILTGVDSFDIEQYHWSDDFELQIANQFTENNKLPFGIKVSIHLVDGREFYRLFDLANGS